MIFEEDVDSFLLRYLLNELDPEDREKVEEWIVANEGNRQYYRTYQKTHLELRWEERSKKIEGNFIQFYRLRRKQHFRRVFYRSVACVIILLSVGSAFWYWDREPEVQLVQECIQPGKSQAILYMASGQVVNVDKDAKELREADGTCINVDSVAGMTYNVATGENSSEVLYNRVVVPKGGEFKLTLSDGTKVWLNSYSELRYPVNFTGNKREVILQGEAYFDVIGDPERPFVVKVNDLDISVLGTQFNVNAYTEGIVKTVLVEGLVNLRGKMGEINLHPRQMGEYRETDGNLHMTEVDVLPHVAWKDGNFIFKSESLEDIMDKLSIWYNLDVFYANDELRSIRLSGNLFRYGDVNQLFTLFEKISDARFQVEVKSVVISYK